MQQRLAEESEFIVGCRGFALIKPEHKYKIYTEYCPHDDLFHMKNRYYNAEFKGENGVPAEAEIPEEFIWYTFLALVEACLVMQQGGVEEAKDGWEPIVHRDMKPGNGKLRS